THFCSLTASLGPARPPCGTCPSYARSLVDLPFALPADTNLAPVAHALVSDPARLVALLAEHHEVRDRDGGLLLDDPALHLLLRVRLGVALDDVHALDERAVLLRIHAQDAPALALVLARNDEDG